MGGIGRIGHVEIIHTLFNRGKGLKFLLNNSEELPGKVTIGQKGKRGKKDTHKYPGQGKWVFFIVLHGDFQLR